MHSTGGKNQTVMPILHDALFKIKHVLGEFHQLESVCTGVSQTFFINVPLALLHKSGHNNKNNNSCFFDVQHKRQDIVYTL